MDHPYWPRFLEIVADDLGMDRAMDEWLPKCKMLDGLVDEYGDVIDVQTIDIVSIAFELSKEWGIDLPMLNPWKDQASGKLQHLTLGILFDMVISELGAFDAG